MARRLSLPAPLAVFAVTAVVADLTAQAGLWFVPFLSGLAAGAVSLRVRGILLAEVAGTVAGWAVPLWVLALRGLPAGATARAIAGLAGVPPYAAVIVVVTLLLAALQALAGTWLARALLPRPRAAREPAPATERAAADE